MRSDPFITVTCDGCGDSIEVGLTAIARKGYDERYVDDELESKGWITAPGNLDFCSKECVKKWLKKKQ